MLEQLKEKIRWNPPQINFKKINFDAAFQKENKTMGSGLILIDDAGSFGGAWCIPGVAENE